MRDDRKNIILNMSFSFVLEIMKFCEKLDKQNKYVISNQLLKSGIIIRAHLRVAQLAENESDFIEKLKITAKEAIQIEYWLQVFKQTNDDPDTDILLNKASEIINVLSNTIISSQAEG